MNEPSAAVSVQHPLMVEKPKGLAEVQTGEIHPDASMGDVFAQALHVVTSQTGGGHGDFPALAGTLGVRDEDPERHTEVILYGMEGEAIEEVEYSVGMPPLAEQLSDEEEMTIVDHERTSWRK